MSPFFVTVVTLVIFQRLIELRIARRNARLIKAIGGFELGSRHYPLVVGLHILFFVSLLLECGLSPAPLANWWWIPFGLFVLAQVGRYWCIKSLGVFWNTRVLVLPGVSLVKSGPYRFMRHPNYWIVGIELAALPLTFSAYGTALLFPLLHFLFLRRFRLPVEELALSRLKKP